MSFLRHKVNPDELPPSDMAIRLHDGEGEAPKHTRWGMILVVFMRLMAGLWLAQGLVEWSLVPKWPDFGAL